MHTNLSRFHERAAEGWHAIALRELSSGQKQSHWMWWVFPQLDGLGNSPLANRYALEDDDESRSFVEDPILRSNLTEVTAAVVRALQAGRSPQALMGNATDVRKLVSALTLFAAVCDPDAASEQALRSSCERALGLLATHGHPRCAYTLDALGL
ncbi:MAG TPA: DUF1810 domain-containing protein [Deltaproteobacteria bacterium]|nr:DUF1810 domain-containing protein [Deltaproteobacteria bacterium]